MHTSLDSLWTLWYDKLRGQKTPVVISFRVESEIWNVQLEVSTRDHFINFQIKNFICLTLDIEEKLADHGGDAKDATGKRR